MRWYLDYQDTIHDVVYHVEKGVLVENVSANRWKLRYQLKVVPSSYLTGEEFYFLSCNSRKKEIDLLTRIERIFYRN